MYITYVGAHMRVDTLLIFSIRVLNLRMHKSNSSDNANEMCINKTPLPETLKDQKTKCFPDAVMRTFSVINDII
jgi:hypothetical protein